MRKVSSVLVLFALIVVICLAVVGVRMSPSSTTTAPSQTRTLTLNNKTQAFRIVEAVRGANDVQLTFRNDYPQGINAFTLAGGPTSGVQVDLAHNGNLIAPGATYHYQVAAASLEPSASNEKPLNITVINVVFEDGTGDGDTTAVADIQNRRLGERMAYARIVPLLAVASQTPNDQTTVGIEKLRERISTLCENLAKGQSGEVYGGILHGKGYVLSEIQQIQELRTHGRSLDLPDEILRIHQRYQKRLQRLERIVK